jgi:type I restriction enzyme, S subunit
MSSHPTIPKGWSEVTLGDVATEYSVRVDNPAESEFERFVGSNHIGRFEFTVSSWGSTSEVTSAMKVFQPGDYLLVRRSLYASDFRERAARADFEGVCSGDILTIREKEGVIAPGYLSVVLNAPDIWAYVVAHATGSITRRIKWRQLKQYKFVLPPVREQRRTAEVLQATEALSKRFLEASASADVVRGSLVSHFILGSSKRLTLEELDAKHLPLGWSVQPASELCSSPITKGATPAKELTENDTGIPFLKVYNLTFDGSLDFSVKPTFVTCEGHHDLRRSSIVSGDVLMNIVGPPLGKVSLIPNGFPEANINQAIARYRLTDQRMGAWFAEYLLSPLAQSWLQARSKKTSGQRNLTLETCRTIPVPIPPPTELEGILGSLRQVREKALSLKARTADVRALGRALMSESKEVAVV